MKHSLVFYLALAFVVAVACEETAPTTSSSPTPLLLENCRVSDNETRKLFELEGDIVIDIALMSLCDYRRGEPLRVGIVQSTVKEYASISYSVLNKVVTTPATIEITLLSIQQPYTTADEIGPASTASIFEMPDGVYSLNLIRSSQMDSYWLMVADTGVTLLASSVSFTKLGNSFASPK